MNKRMKRKYELEQRVANLEKQVVEIELEKILLTELVEQHDCAIGDIRANNARYRKALRKELEEYVTQIKQRIEQKRARKGLINRLFGK